MIYYIYFHKFDLNIQLLTYEPSEGEAKTRSDPDFLRIQDTGLVTILGPTHDLGL